jgi:hypothetical protein
MERVVVDQRLIVQRAVGAGRSRHVQLFGDQRSCWLWYERVVRDRREAIET